MGKIGGKIGQGIGSTVGGALGNIGGNLLQGFLGFEKGGKVPGKLGQPRLAIVHGGEVVIPNSHSALKKMALGKIKGKK